MSDQSKKFAAQVRDLVGVIQLGIADTEWVTQEYPKEMRDEEDDFFTVPTLTLQKGPKRLFLDPTGYDIPGAEGVADLYVMPSGVPVASLYREADGWKIHSPFPSGVMTTAKPKEWGRADVDENSIRTVLEAIANHES